MSKLLAIAHRGAELHAPENTVLAIEKAIAMGADAIEIDVQVCRTGEAVVIHDKTVDRTTNSTGDVSLFSMDELRQLDAGQGQRIPRLMDLLRATKQACPFFIELKTVKAAKPVAEVIDHLVQIRGWHYRELIVISKLHQSLALLHTINPRIITGASLSQLPESMAAVGDITGSRYVLPEISILNKPFMDDAKKRGVKVITWTCNSDAEIAKAKSLGVDGIISSRFDSI